MRAVGELVRGFSYSIPSETKGKTYWSMLPMRRTFGLVLAMLEVDLLVCLLVVVRMTDGGSLLPVYDMYL